MPPVITPEGQDAKARIAQAKELRASGMSSADARRAVRTPIAPTVSANELTNPPAPITPPVPAVNTNDGSRTAGLVSNVVGNTQNFIASESEAAQKRDELAGLIGTQTFDGAGQRTRLGEELGLPTNLARLKDIQTQLARENTDSALVKSRIAGAAGQTMASAQRQVTQEDRENAIRTAGLAAESAVLTNNITTATNLINSAMSDYYADRQMNNANMISQLEYFSGIADGETAQLLEQEKRVYEADQAKVERVQTAVDAALTSGATTASEIAMLTDPRTTDDERLAVSQAVVARASKNLYDAKLYGEYLSNTLAQKELDALNTPPDPNVVDPKTLEIVSDLTDGQRTAITGSRETINEIDRMVALVETTGDMSLLTKATPEGREFLRLRQNVVDKLARQRTGAVVGADEEKTFKQILGVGAFDLIAKDADEVVDGLKKFRTPHEEALNLNDPEGRVRDFLDSQKVSEDEDEINAIWGINTPVETASVSSYFN